MTAHPRVRVRIDGCLVHGGSAHIDVLPARTAVSLPASCRCAVVGHNPVGYCWVDLVPLNEDD